MRLSEQTWPVLVSKVRLGSDEYRVVRPARAVENALLYEGRYGAHFEIGKRAAVVLAMAWGLAARSPHSLIHLPLRGPTSADDVRPLDLVLLHHRLAFPVSRWKEVRARLGRGAPHRVTLPPRAFRRASHHPQRHREFRDHLRWSVAADTLLLIGSRTAFELEVHRVRALAEDGPAHLAKYPGIHYCTEIGMGRTWTDRRNPSAELHVDHLPLP
ncbi:hypothetical protein [Herbidospora mongoliensis]|uniref:hypothetical protein n=1 Tax=Herbidospora mongoliensis TaxID=688067 RepID=UPI00082C622A|nr:hypothetical protein [Herbidospora mongoliensis]